MNAAGTPMLGLREQKKLDTWRAIRSAAVTLFQEHGYDAVGVSDIVLAARVSNATFFNYFAAKQSVVFDVDPTDAATVSSLLRARPAGERAWTSLSTVLLHYVESVGDALVVQKQLQAASPTLARSGRELGDRIRSELLDWVRVAHPDLSELDATLLVHVAIAALVAAYTAWDPARGTGGLVRTAEASLGRVGASFG